jgi:hypothetical protein
MKLSEAIRLGSMNGPQVFGRLGDFSGGTCAQGAAVLAIGLMPDAFKGISIQARFIDAFPVSVIPVRCPECETRNVAGNVMAHLNNDHKWTRERIADWVETIERAHEPHDPACDSSGVTQGQAETTAVALCAPK